MGTFEPPLQQVLDDHLHLDLTADMAKTGSTQVGGGGFSDVFRSKMRRGWEPRLEPSIQKLLNLEKTDYSPVGSAKRRKVGKKSNCIVVAVKRLRFWDNSILKVEKVFSSAILYLTHPFERI